MREDCGCVTRRITSGEVIERIGLLERDSWTEERVPDVLLGLAKGVRRTYVQMLFELTFRGYYLVAFHLRTVIEIGGIEGRHGTCLTHSSGQHDSTISLATADL